MRDVLEKRIKEEEERMKSKSKRRRKKNLILNAGSVGKGVFSRQLGGK